VSLKSHAWAAFLYAALTVLMTWPLASRLNLIEAGDSSYFAWVMAWTTRALLHDPLSLPHANTLHPLRYALFLDDEEESDAVDEEFDEEELDAVDEE
jgi:hypothetical protein